MSETCCEFHPPAICGPAKCPACGALGKPVKRITLGALLKPEHRPRIPIQEEFCFCRTANCEVVYFRPGEVHFQKEDLAVKVGLKEPNDPTVPVCYCFGWMPEKIRSEVQAIGKSTVVDQIKAQVKTGNCYCEVTNPQGSCCLGNITGVVQKVERDFQRIARAKGGMNMSKTVLLVLMSALAVGAAYASEAGEGAVVPPHQAIVQVKGVVCSFCAYGTEKNLSKLQFLDSTQFGDGVLMDIHANRITLALAHGKPVDLKGIHEAIVKGGYDPVRVHLRLRGTLERHGDRSLLTDSETGQVFELKPRGPEPLPEQGVVEIQAHLEADRIPSLAEGQPIRVTVDTLEKVS